MRPKKKSVTHHGRPKKPRLFSSLGQAAGALGVSFELLKLAKKMGCDAFRAGGRVNEGELLHWMKEHEEEMKDVPAASGASLKDQKLMEEVRKLRIRNDLAESEVVKTSLVAALIHKCAANAIAPIRQKLEIEYPSLLVGTDVAQNRVYGKRIADEVISELQKAVEEFDALQADGSDEMGGASPS